MARRMSCSMTVDAVRERRKTVTRRHVDTWTTLKVGDRLTLIEKGMGLAKGERQIVLAEVEIIAVSVEPIQLMRSDVRYGRQETRLEGLPEMTPDEFVAFWLNGHGHRTGLDDEGFPLPIQCRRIHWRYLDRCHVCPNCGCSFSLPVGRTCDDHQPVEVWQ